MLSIEFITAWLLVMFPLVYSPGPANTLFAANGAKYGFQRSMPFLTGIDIGLIIQSLVVGFGISKLLLHTPVLFTVIRFAGIVYIAWLGLVFLKAAMSKNKEQTHCLSFADGLLLTSLNPKAWVMQVMMFTQFLGYEQSITVGITKLTLLLAMLNISGHMVWVLFGSVMLSRATSAFSTRMQNSLFSAMLFGSIYFLL